MTAPVTVASQAPWTTTLGHAAPPPSPPKGRIQAVAPAAPWGKWPAPVQATSPSAPTSSRSCARRSCAGSSRWGSAPGTVRRAPSPTARPSCVWCRWRSVSPWASCLPPLASRPPSAGPGSSQVRAGTTLGAPSSTTPASPAHPCPTRRAPPPSGAMAAPRACPLLHQRHRQRAWGQLMAVPVGLATPQGQGAVPAENGSSRHQTPPKRGTGRHWWVRSVHPLAAPSVQWAVAMSALDTAWVLREGAGLLCSGPLLREPSPSSSSPHTHASQPALPSLSSCLWGLFARHTVRAI